MLLAFRQETAFAHYANHIDSISNAFIRLITPEVKSVRGKASERTQSHMFEST